MKKRNIANLINAIKTDNLELLLACLSGGVNPDDAKDDVGRPAIVLIAINDKGGGGSCLAVLLAAGANPNLVYVDGERRLTALDCAINVGNTSVERILRANGGKRAWELEGDDEAAARVEDVSLSFGVGGGAWATGVRRRRKPASAAAVGVASDSPSMGGGR